MTDEPVVREPEDPDLLVVRPADQSGAEDDPDADQHLDDVVPEQDPPGAESEDEEPE